MNDLQIFSNEEFGSIRTVTIDNELWFVGKDVAAILGYAKPENAVASHIDTEDKTSTLIQGNGTNYKSKAIIINESGLYSLILSSKMPNAKRFKHWVTSEILPSIRKHGAYMTEQTLEQALTSPDFLIQLATKLKDEQEKNKALTEANNRMRPKEIFADAVMTSEHSILIGELAKLIAQNGYAIGQKRLFAWMREHGYLLKQGGSYNLPAQRYVEAGLFEIKESSISNPDGSVRLTRTTKVTGKGQVYFINKFLKEVA
ncbi:phage antirepressor KilAC domain-containing protein [Blautia stercoris]|jgi:anti-repressor protein